MFNKQLRARRERPLSINELALCAQCYPLWKAERDAVTAEERQHDTKEWHLFKGRAKFDVEQAWHDVPPVLKENTARGYEWRELAHRYVTWLKEQKKKRRGATEDY
jgi:hypothetical protein